MSTSLAVDPVEFLDYASSIAWNAMTRTGAFGRETFEDVQQDAHVALCEAAGRFKPDLGVPFTAFAVRRIQGAVQDGFRQRGWWSRVSHEQGARVPLHFGNAVDYDAFIAAARAGFEEELVERLAGEQRHVWLAGHADLVTPRQRDVLTEILAGAPTHLEVARRLGITDAAISHHVKMIVARLRPLARSECAHCPSLFHRQAVAA